MKNPKRNDLVSIGFALLFFGILLATVLNVGYATQIVGLVFIIIASAFFGASFKADKADKK